MSRFDGIIARIFEVVSAFVFAEGSAQVPDVAPGVFPFAFLCHAHPVLDLGKGLFDGVEVGGIRWQEPEPCAGGSYGRTDGLA